MGPPMIWYDGHLIPWEVDDCGAYKVSFVRLAGWSGVSHITQPSSCFRLKVVKAKRPSHVTPPLLRSLGVSRLNRREKIKERILWQVPLKEGLRGGYIIHHECRSSILHQNKKDFLGDQQKERRPIPFNSRQKLNTTYGKNFKAINLLGAKNIYEYDQLHCMDCLIVERKELASKSLEKALHDMSTECAEAKVSAE
ncbi:unnamed protein product [Sphenostylis stenocarpa]|uniref:Uncharacterized protein n=1 Tax=Sphenostylis stenocarpa TaxID=92480 RepID=A0AA86RT85_9FABA|nr:unnamed protein product [Sphenostylis stenocarpa]